MVDQPFFIIFDAAAIVVLGWWLWHRRRRRLVERQNLSSIGRHRSHEIAPANGLYRGIALLRYRRES